MNRWAACTCIRLSSLPTPHNELRFNVSAIRPPERLAVVKKQPASLAAPTILPKKIEE